MPEDVESRPPRGIRGSLPVLLLALGTIVPVAACAGGPAPIPEPRPLVVYTGVRLTTDHERMQEVHAWVTEAVETIREDPSFFLDQGTVPEPAYPWQTLEFRSDDTVRIAFERSAPDAQTSYWIYAFLHQMDRMDRLDEWLPEAEGLEGFELERAIVERTADSWLLGRSTFDTHPYKPLDELIFAQDAGMLEAFLLATRPDEFPEARERFLAENPGGFEEFEAWYQETFGGDPPGTVPGR